MATLLTVYGKVHYGLLRARFNFASDSFYCALVGSGYTPNTDNDEVWATVSPFEIAAANGYSSGGVLMSNVSVTYSAGSATFSADPTTISASGGGNIAAWRYAVVRKSGVVDGVTDPIVAHILGDTTPLDVPANNLGWQIVWNGSGIFVL